MYLEHFGLSAPPFRITPHPEFFFEGAHRGETLGALVYAIDAGEGLMTVTGEVGSGKTMLCRVLAERLPERVDTVYLANPSLTADELLLTIADDLGARFDESRPASRVRQLQDILIERYAAGRQVVVLIDEAHAMPDATLEEVRLLSNLDHGHHKLLQIVLFGQPELNERLLEPGLRQLRERITYRFELGPLDRPDVAAYVDWRLRAAGYTGANPFGSYSLRLIARAAKGLTRRINILADKSLLAAFADDQHEVTARHVRRAIKDCGFASSGFSPWLLAGVAVLTAAGLGVGLFVQLPVAPSAGIVPAASSKVMAIASISEHKIASMPAASVVVASKPAVSEIAAASLPAALPASKPAALLASVPEGSHRTVEESRQRLNSAPAGSTSVMLGVATADRLADMEALYMLAGKRLPVDQLLLLPARVGGRMGWGVFYGFFPDRAAAQNALTALPEEFRKDQPFVRTAEGMKNELRVP